MDTSKTTKLTTTQLDDLLCSPHLHSLGILGVLYGEHFVFDSTQSICSHSTSTKLVEPFDVETN